MNLSSEQLDRNSNIFIDKDQALSQYDIYKLLREILGAPKCSIEYISNRKLFVFERKDKRKIVILAKAITYLGGNGQHGIYKKRIQLSNWYKEVCIDIDSMEDYDVIFLGVYHYNGNIIFSDFRKDTYLRKKMNNSAAHVYINDLYQAQLHGIFRKIDKFGNTIVTINHNILRSYLEDEVETSNSIFEIINRFNDQFPFDQWITAEDAIEDMYMNQFSQWRQAEWAGWYLESLFDKFIKQKGLKQYIEYVGLIHKSKGQLDFDLLIDESFYGDLKASSVSSNAILLNDQNNLINAIETYGKFWYIIYSHDSRKDKDYDDYPMTKYRALKIYEDKNNDNSNFNLYSYKSKMKHSVRFNQMVIIELNKNNLIHAVDDFNQGVQPDGSQRKPKFKISKKKIDNFVIYRYTR